jgi:amino acid transporter
MSPFSSFAISMSTICILAGGVTSFSVSICSVGGASIGLGWPLECLFALAVALTMAQVASAFPTAGGTYHWAYTLGGRGWGWATACFSLAGMVTVLAAVNVGLCRFAIGAGSRVGNYNPDNVYPWVQHVAVVGMCFLQAFINHRGIRLTSRLNDFNGYLIMVVAPLLTISLVVFGVVLKGNFEPSRLVTFTNYSGEPPGNRPVVAATLVGLMAAPAAPDFHLPELAVQSIRRSAEVWPHSESIVLLFLLGMLLPAYTLNGFDAAAQTSEETLDAPRVVPRGIIRAVLVSGIAGWVFLVALVLAAPSMDAAANASDQSFFEIIRTTLPYHTHFPIYVGLALAQFLCGLAVVTSASRMTYAFARDGGLPGASFLRRVSPTRHTPSVAIWVFAGAAALFAVSISYTAIAAVCAIFLYLSYVLPTALGMLAHGRTWTRMGPWHLGRWYRPLAALCVLGCIVLFVIGMQPPNDIAVWVVGGSFLALLALWFGYMRRHFPGPPAAILEILRTTASPAGDVVPPQGTP